MHEREPSWSWIWLVPIVAALLAGALSLQAWSERGVPVAIQFKQGHGLQAGDALRHRGITVGEVAEVTLSPDLAAVIVKVRLQPDAADLARIGSRFWIVRPQLGLEGISGLETLVGARYLAVQPGKGDPQRVFLGLDEAPVPDTLQGGLEITLEGSHRGSLSPGSPVTYRKIRIGTVHSVGLASDARTVEVGVRIRAAYVPLVRQGTRFWDSSGLSFDVGITGVSLQLDTLQALAMGGIAMATPTDAGPIVSTGHRFALHREAEDEWTEWRPSLPIGAPALPAGLTAPRPLRASLVWTQTRLWTWSDDERRPGWVLAVPGGLLAPADMLAAPEQAEDQTTLLEVAGQKLGLDVEAVAVGPDLARLPLDAPLPDASPDWPRERQRSPQGPEDCLVVTESSAEPTVLAASRLTVHDATWRVDGALSFDASDHGACIVARSDGRLIGLLLVEGDGARVAPLP